MLLRLSVAARVALWAVQLYLNRTLASPEASGGIVSLELACTEDKAGCILDEWDAADPKIRKGTRQGVGCNFLFCSLLCHDARTRPHPIGRGPGNVVGMALVQESRLDLRRVGFDRRGL